MLLCSNDRCSCFFGGSEEPLRDPHGANSWLEPNEGIPIPGLLSMATERCCNREAARGDIPISKEEAREQALRAEAEKEQLGAHGRVLAAAWSGLGEE